MTKLLFPAHLSYQHYIISVMDQGETFCRLNLTRRPGTDVVVSKAILCNDFGVKFINMGTLVGDFFYS